MSNRPTYYRIRDGVPEVTYENLESIGILEEVPVYECSNCGIRSFDEDAFVTVNTEPPTYSMDDPYGGWPGELLCQCCAERRRP